MSLEIALTENTAAIRELISRLATAAPIPPEAVPAVAPAPKPAAAAPTPRTAQDVPAAVPETKAAVPETKAEATARPVTYDDVKRAILDVSKTKGRDAAVALLAQFGVKSGPELQAAPDKFGAFVAAAQALLA